MFSTAAHSLRTIWAFYTALGSEIGAGSVVLARGLLSSCRTVKNVKRVVKRAKI